MKKGKWLVVLMAIVMVFCMGIFACTPSDPGTGGPGTGGEQTPDTPSITLNQTSANLDLYETVQLTATTQNVSGTVTWSSSNASAATVDGNGFVTAVAEGQATITATVGSISATCTVTVTNSYTAPVLDVLSNVGIAKDDSYTVKVKTLWKGEALNEAITYTWALADGEADDIASFTTANNGAEATFTGLKYGSANYTVTATVRGTTLVANVLVTVANLNVTFDVANLQMGIGAFEAYLGLLETDGHVSSVAPEIAVYEEGTLVENANLTLVSANPEIAKVEGGRIIAVSEGVANITAVYEDSTLVIRANVYRPELVLDERVVVETALTLTNNYLNVNSDIQGEVTGVKVIGRDVFVSADDDGIKIDSSKLPQAITEMGENKEVIIETSVAKYVSNGAMYTLYITEASDLDLIKDASYAADSAPNFWGGYFALGNDIEYNKVFTPINDIATLNKICQEHGITGNGDGPHDSRHNGFRGVFDGRGYNINGVQMTYWAGGMFPIFGGTIKNVSFTNAVLPGNTSLLCHNNGGTIENVYIHVAELGVNNGDNAGALTGGGGYGVTRINNCFVDVPHANGLAIGAAHDGYGVINGVYAVGDDTPLSVISTGGGVRNTYAGYSTYNDLVAKCTADFSSWSKDFWTVINGVPFPKNLEVPEVEPSVSVQTATGYNVNLPVTVGKYTVLSLNPEALEAGVTITGNNILIPNNEALAGTRFTITAKDVFGKMDPVSVEVYILATDEVAVTTVTDVDVSKSSVTIDLGDALDGVQGTLTGASINDKPFTSFSMSGSELTLDTAGFKGIWGEQNVYLTYELKEGEEVISATNVSVPVDIFRSISNKNEIIALDTLLTMNGKNAYGNFRVVADIDMGGAGLPGVGTWSDGWTHCFQGTFDGQGHTISNFTSGGVNRGLFSFVGPYGVVKDIVFMNVYLPGTSGLIATQCDGVVENIFVYATMLETGKTWAPGSAIIAKAETTSTIKNAFVILDAHKIGETADDSYAGGVAGWSKGNVENAVLVNLDEVKLYAVGQSSTTIKDQADTDSATVKSFQGFGELLAWISEDSETAQDVIGWAMEPLQEVLTTNCAVTAPSKFATPGGEIKLNFKKGYVVDWKLKNAVDGVSVANGVVTVENGVAGGTTFTVVASTAMATDVELDFTVVAGSTVTVADVEIDLTKDTALNVTLETLPEGELENVSIGGIAVDATLNGNTVSVALTEIAKLSGFEMGKKYPVEIKFAKKEGGVVVSTTDVKLNTVAYTMVISNTEELNAFANVIDGYVVLDTDFTYTGTYTRVASNFIGTFDGRGHIIRNFKTNTGLVSMLATVEKRTQGCIKNLILLDAVGTGGAIVSNAGAGQIEDVFMTIGKGNTAAALTADNYGDRRIRRVVVDFQGNAGHAINGYHEGFGIAESIMQISGTSVVGSKWTDNGGADGACVKLHYADWATAKAAQLNLTAFDNDFWDIVDYLPIPTTMNGVDVEITNTNTTVLQGDKLTLTANGYFLNWTVEGAGATMDDNVLTATEVGEVTVTATNAITGDSDSIVITVTGVQVTELDAVGDVEIADTSATTFSIDVTEAFSGSDITEVRFGETVVTEYTIDGNNVVFNKADVAKYYGEQNVTIYAGTKKATTTVAIITKIIRNLDDINRMEEYAFSRSTETWELWGPTFTEDIWTGYYVLGNDIDLSGQDVATKINTSGGRVWYAGNAGFHGTFDGRGHYIYGGTYNEGGLFGHVNTSGVVKNVALVDITLSASSWANAIAVSFWGTLENVLITIADDNRNNGEGGAVIVNGTATAKYNNVIVYDEGGRTTANAGKLSSYINHQEFGTQTNVYVFTNYYVAQATNEGKCPVDPIALGTTLAGAGVDKTKFDDGIWNLTGDIALFDSMTAIVDVPVIKNVETEMHYGTTLTLVAEKGKYVTWSLDQTAIDAGFAVNGNVVSAPANGSLESITITATSATSGKTATYTVSVVSASVITGNGIGKVGAISSAETFTIDLSAVTTETIVGELTSAAVGTTQFTTATKEGNIVTLNRSALTSVNGECTISLVFKDGASVTAVSVPATVVTMYITSEADLALMASTIATAPNATYELGADIVCTGTYTTPTATFEGTFNGNGYTIYNFKSTFALFGTVGANSVVKNVSFVNATVDGQGSVICREGGGRIENVYVSVNMLNAVNGAWSDGVVPTNYGSSVLFGDAFGSKRVNMVFIDYIQKTGAETAGMPGWWVHQGYGIWKNVYAVGVSQLHEHVGEIGSGTEPEVFAAYSTWADYETAAPDVSGWDNDFWDIVDGKPVPARLKATAFTLTKDSETVTAGSTVKINGWAYANLALDQTAIDAGFTLAGNVLTVPADAAGKSATVTATAIYDETVTGSITITVAGTIEIAEKVNADVKNATFTVDLSTVKGSVGDVVSVKAGDLTFANVEYVAETGILTLDTATLAGVWGDVELEITTSASIVKANALVYRSISTADELNAIPTYLTKTGEVTYNGYFVLTADVDFKDGIYKGVGAWENVNGADKWSYRFQGTFDGQNHVISNFTIANRHGGTGANLGMFSCTDAGSVIKNLYLLNVTNAACGGVIATEHNGTIENVAVYGATTNGATWAPGSLIVSKNQGTINNALAVVTNCNGGDQYAGAVAGWSKGTVSNAIALNLTTNDIYAVGQSSTTIGAQANTDTDTVKTFKGIDAYGAFIQGEGATAEWTTFPKSALSKFVGIFINPTCDNDYVVIGSTAQIKVSSTAYVGGYSIKTAIDGISVDANGLVTVADTVANNTAFTVVVTGLDGTQKELNLVAKAVSLVEKTISGVDVQTSQAVNEIVVDGVDSLGELVSATMNGAALDGVSIEDNKIIIDGDKVGFANYGDDKTFLIKTVNGSDYYNVTINATVVTRVFTTADDLETFWDYTGWQNSNTYYDGYYVLGADIEYDRNWNCNWLWTEERAAAGGWYSNVAGAKQGGFVGIFDGRGHYVDGIAINSVGGLFGGTGEPARIRNIAFTNVTFNYDNASFIALGGGISMSNIYVQVNELRNGASPNGSGVLLGADSYGCNRISNVFVDIKAIADGVAESGATANENALGRFHDGYGVLSNILVVTQGARPFYTMSTGGGAMNDVLAYTTRADMKAASNWQTKFENWDTNVWTTDADGLPIFKSLVD